MREKCTCGANESVAKKEVVTWSQGFPKSPYLLAHFMKNSEGESKRPLDHAKIDARHWIAHDNMNLQQDSGKEVPDKANARYTSVSSNQSRKPSGAS